MAPKPYIMSLTLSTSPRHLEGCANLGGLSGTVPGGDTDFWDWDFRVQRAVSGFRAFRVLGVNGLRSLGCLGSWALVSGSYIHTGLHIHMYERIFINIYIHVYLSLYLSLFLSLFLSLCLSLRSACACVRSFVLTENGQLSTLLRVLFFVIEVKSSKSR